MLEVLRDSAEQVLTRYRNVLLLAVRKAAPLEDVLALGDAVRQTHRETGKKVGLVHLVGAIIVAPPPEDARKAYGTLMRDPTVPVACSGVIVEQQGFAAAVVRSVITSLALLARPSFPTKVFATAEETARWVHAELAKVDSALASAEDVLAACGELRAHVAA